MGESGHLYLSDWVMRMAERFKEELMVIPGIEYEFTQPIEMRFNELITGVRSDISALNRYLATAFGGETAGLVFEGERRFDLVLRFDPESRTDIEDISRMQVPLPGGAQLPLSELADIYYTEGPAKISRENTHHTVKTGKA